MCWNMTILDWEGSYLKEPYGVAYWSLCHLLSSFFFLWTRTEPESSLQACRCSWLCWPYCSHVSAENPVQSNTFFLLRAPNSSPFGGMKCRLTEEISVFLDCDSKSIAWLLNPEEDHCHVLWWPDAPLNIPTFTEVYVSLRSSEGMVQGTGKFLPLEYPSIKHLQRFNNLK